MVSAWVDIFSKQLQKNVDIQTKDLFSFALNPVWFTKLLVLTRDKICSPNPAGLIFNLRATCSGLTDLGMLCWSLQGYEECMSYSVYVDHVS